MSEPEARGPEEHERGGPRSGKSQPIIVSM